MRVNEACKTCELRCELARIERDLGAAILQAHERQGQALTGMEIASNVVGDLVTDRELKRMITEAGGQGDDPHYRCT